jgi:hypothetical protein
MKRFSTTRARSEAETVCGQASELTSCGKPIAAPAKPLTKEPWPEKDDGGTAPTALWERLYVALGPIAGCLVLDLVDFVTLGPIGLVIGIPIGAAVGWWLGSLYGLERPGRITVAVLSAVYCTIPFTELLPLATLSGAVARFHHAGRLP